MLILKFIAKLIKILQSEASPSQIAGGFILGMIIGLTPFMNVHNLFILLLIILLRVNISMAIFSFLLFSLFAYIFDPLFHNFGYWLLVDVSALQNTWTAMYDNSFIALTHFNNTVVMGSLTISIALLLPMFFIVKFGVVGYRKSVYEKVKNSKAAHAFKASPVYSIYEKISKLGRLGD